MADVQISHQQRRKFVQDVLGLLYRFKAETDSLWCRVAEHNDAQPMAPDARRSITFYFGQNIDDPTLIDPEWREE